MQRALNLEGPALTPRPCLPCVARVRAGPGEPAEQVRGSEEEKVGGTGNEEGARICCGEAHLLPPPADRPRAAQDLMAAEAASGGAAGGKGKKGKGKGGSAGGEAGADTALGSGEDITNQMSTQQLMSTGRRTMSETEKSIQRSARVVEDTIAIGQQTAAMLSEQTHQMEKIVNDLDEIQFSMKKAKKLIGDITRSMATDKCILMILMLIVGGIVVIIILKVAKVKLVKGINISVPLPTSSPPPPLPPPLTPPSAGHRKLLHRPQDSSDQQGWEHVAALWLAWLQAHLALR